MSVLIKFTDDTNLRTIQPKTRIYIYRSENGWPTEADQKKKEGWNIIVQSSKSWTEGLTNIHFKLKASTEKRGGEKSVSAGQQHNIHKASIWWEHERG